MFTEDFDVPSSFTQVLNIRSISTSIEHAKLFNMTDERAPKRRRLSLTTEDEDQPYDTYLSLQDTKDNAIRASRTNQSTSTLLAQPISPPLRKNVWKGDKGHNENPLSSGRVSPLLLSEEGTANGLIYTQNAPENQSSHRVAARKNDDISDARLVPSYLSAVDQESRRLPYDKTSLKDANAPLSTGEKHNGRSIRAVSSPIMLNRIEGLSDYSNLDTMSLRDIVGDPLIKECWVFNYLFDVDFLL